MLIFSIILLLVYVLPKRAQTVSSWRQVMKSERQIYHSVRFSHSVVSDSLWPHGLQHASPCSLSITNSWSFLRLMSIELVMPANHPILVPFSSHLQSFLASASYQMSQLFPSGGQSIGVSASASVLPVNIQDWSPLGWTGWISLQSKGLSKVFFNTTVQKHQFFGAQFSL